MDPSSSEVPQQVWMAWPSRPFFTSNLLLKALWLNPGLTGMVAVTFNMGDFSRKGWGADKLTPINKQGSHALWIETFLGPIPKLPHRLGMEQPSIPSIPVLDLSALLGLSVFLQVRLSIFASWYSSAAIFSKFDAFFLSLVMWVLLVDLPLLLVFSLSGNLQDMWPCLPQGNIVQLETSSPCC